MKWWDWIPWSSFLVAVPFFRRSPQPRDWTQVSRIASGFSGEDVGARDRNVSPVFRWYLKQDWRTEGVTGNNEEVQGLYRGSFNRRKKNQQRKRRGKLGRVWCILEDKWRKCFLEEQTMDCVDTTERLSKMRTGNWLVDLATGKSPVTLPSAVSVAWRKLSLRCH